MTEAEATDPDAQPEREPGRDAGEASRIRPLFIAVGAATIVVMLVVLAVWFRTGETRTDRGALEPGERRGIDVSTHQHEIDWPSVRSDGIDFAYIKATEGGDFVDDHFASNWTEAKNAGVERGAYHFFTLCRPGADQADNFLRTVPRDADALAPVVDLEFVGNCSGRPARDALINELTAFVDRVEAATGKKLIFYLLDDFDQQYKLSEVFDRERWVRSINQRPSSDDWLIWQTSDVGLVAGIEGDVDLDVMKQPS